MEYDVCVTDCDTKHGFAISRYLQKRGLRILCQYRNKKNPYYYTIHNKHKYICNIHQQNYEEEFLIFLEQVKPAVIMPVSNKSVRFISDHRERIKKFTKVLLPEKESLEIAQNKFKTFKYIEGLGIPFPKTIFHTANINELEQKLAFFNFPVVLKYVNVGETGVKYCSSKEELFELLNEYDNPNATPPLVQEYIEGVGVGFYALYNHGVCINLFMHKRLHEYPITGGASSFAISYYSKELEKMGLDILDSLQWNGIAMVEFKLTNDNKLFLIEINPKFWGSYELSEKCGISFAYDYYKTALGEKVQKNDYRLNVSFRWLFSEIMYYRDKILSTKNMSRPKIKREHGRSYNDLYFDEPLIFFARIIDILVRMIIKKINPHSIPFKNVN
jgi:predicted ATP-grasp superfamily ATP-dependent carboligase